MPTFVKPQAVRSPRLKGSGLKAASVNRYLYIFCRCLYVAIITRATFLYCVYAVRQATVFYQIPTQVLLSRNKTVLQPCMLEITYTLFSVSVSEHSTTFNIHIHIYQINWHSNAPSNESHCGDVFGDDSGSLSTTDSYGRCAHSGGHAGAY